MKYFKILVWIWFAKSKVVLGICYKKIVYEFPHDLDWVLRTLIRGWHFRNVRNCQKFEKFCQRDKKIDKSLVISGKCEECSYVLSGHIAYLMFLCTMWKKS